MADFMAKAERAFQRRQSDLLLASPNQMEFPAIQADIDDAIHSEKQASVLAKLPRIVDRKGWHGMGVEGRRAFEAIVEEFGWEVLRKEYLAALREFKNLGGAKFKELGDNELIEFQRK